MEHFYENETYIQMCEKAEEIQKLWEFSPGDFYIHYGNTPPKVQTVDGDGDKYGDFGCACCEGKRFWLPRQDQLQEIMGLDAWQWFELCYKQVQTYPLPCSAEFVCLEIVMENKFNKTWNGKEWIDASLSV